MMASLSNLLALLNSLSAGHLMAAYTAVKLYAAALRAKAAKFAAKAEADAYQEAHKLEAAAKGAEVKVKSYFAYLYAEIKKSV